MSSIQEFYGTMAKFYSLWNPRKEVDKGKNYYWNNDTQTKG